MDTLERPSVDSTGDAPAAPDSPAPSPRPARGHRRLALGAVAAVAVVAGAFGAGALVGGGSSDSTTQLPASTESVTPRKGQTRAGAVYAAASPAVVSVRAGSGAGTGFLVDGDGTVVTNAHVVGGSDTVQIRFGTDRDSIEGTVRGTDPSSDLAVVHIDPQDVPNGVRPLRLADSRNVRVGDVAIAIGNPFGLDRTATEGIVSGTGRQIEAPNGFSIDAVIQTDAPINPGNSGGPLLDDSGRVIGVNSQIETAGSRGNVGIGFAVPSNTVRQVVPVLSRGATVRRPYLGVTSGAASPSTASGAQVLAVVSGGPADRAGVKPGDVITSVDGESVQEPADVSHAIEDNRPGERVELQVRRNGSVVTLQATLGERPRSTP
jgi:putative serine protease PepD